MQRNLLIPIAGGIAAGLVLIAVLFLVGRHHSTTEVAISTPSATPLPTVFVTASPTPTVTPSASPAASASPGAKPTATPHPIRSVSSVDCSAPSDMQFCSRKDGSTYANGAFTPPQNAGPVSSPNGATFTMQSTTASGKIHAVVTIENKTNKTFRFPSREIDFEITKDGQHFDTVTTTGPGFDMTPGTKMTGTFDRPITEDGTYAWQARVWYYVR